MARPAEATWDIEGDVASRRNAAAAAAANAASALSPIPLCDVAPCSGPMRRRRRRVARDDTADPALRTSAEPRMVKRLQRRVVSAPEIGPEGGRHEDRSGGSGGRGGWIWRVSG
jgi:hypothetical protein